jgi:hypothetical protein
MKASEFRKLIREEVRKALKENTYLMSNPSVKEKVEMVIATLKGIDIDGETMEYILDQTGMTDQMTSQLGNKGISEQKLNEDMALVGDIALGVVGGLAGLWALFKGVPAVLGTLGVAAGAMADRMEKKAKEAAAIARKDGRLETIKPIVAKFENDTKLKDMYKALPEYSQSVTAKGKAQNAERTKQMLAIAKYIKSKLTPDEMQYFTDISAMLRTGDIKL